MRQRNRRFFICNVAIIFAINNVFHSEEATAAKAVTTSKTNAVPTKTFKALSNELIQHVNSQPNRTWTAGENLIEPRNHSALKIFQQKGPSTPIKNPLADTPLPVAFDARLQWPQCKSISNIRDQGNCGSCWAVASAAAITDRVCVGFGGTKNPYISEEDVNSCSGSGGCGGGTASGAFAYWQSTGIVSGGSYGTQLGCKPYTVPPCAHYSVSTLTNCKNTSKSGTPRCVKSCAAGFTTNNYTADRYMAREIYWLGNDIPGIQRDIMNNGSAAATYKVYVDFLSYKSGVYQHVTGGSVGNHCVKVFGWGVENSVNFWWAANQWNTAWGDKGFFKIIRGTNEGNIESWMMGGLPLVAAAAAVASDKVAAKPLPPPLVRPTSVPKKSKQATKKN